MEYLNLEDFKPKSHKIGKIEKLGFVGRKITVQQIINGLKKFYNL